MKNEFIDTVNNYDSSLLWKTHSNKCIYWGADGVSLALWLIKESLSLDTDFYFVVVAQNIVDKYYKSPDMGTVIHSYYLGEAGVWGN